MLRPAMEKERRYREIWDSYGEKLGDIPWNYEKLMPDFFVISPAKTRSTWLYEKQICHKDICIKK
jgi:hypothetical protein